MVARILRNQTSRKLGPGIYYKESPKIKKKSFNIQLEKSFQHFSTLRNSQKINDISNKNHQTMTQENGLFEILESSLDYSSLVKKTRCNSFFGKQERINKSFILDLKSSTNAIVSKNLLDNNVISLKSKGEKYKPNQSFENYHLKKCNEASFRKNVKILNH